MQYKTLFGNSLRTMVSVLVAVLFILSGCGGEDPSTVDTPADDLRLSGQVSGLTADGLELSNDADETVIVDSDDTEFSFETEYSEGDDYQITIAAEPDGVECSIANGEGTFAGNDITDVAVDCLNTADFGIDIQQSASNLAGAVGDDIVVVATITNRGDLEGTQDVELTIEDAYNGVERDVTLDNNQSEVVTFVWETGEGDIGDYIGELSTDNETVTADITITDRDFFDVDLDTDTSRLNITADETVEVVANITNVGALPGTQDIDLAVDGNLVDSRGALGLNVGAEQSVKLYWTPDSDDRGDFELEVSSDNDSATATANVVDDAFFDVSINTETSDLEVLQSDPVIIEADVENVGNVDATQDIELSANGGIFDSAPLTVEAGQTESITLQWDTSSVTPGSYLVGVSSDDSSDSAITTVLGPAEFSVDINEQASDLAAAAGHDIRVVTTVNNEGDVAATQDIELDIGNGHFMTADEVTIEPNSTEVLTLTWQTTEDDTGDYIATVSSDDDSDSANITVTELDFFEVTIDTDASDLHVTGDDTVTVVVDVENVGAQYGIQHIDLAVDGQVEDTYSSLGLEAGHESTVELDWTPGDARGDFELVVSSDDHSDSADATVVDAPFVDISIDTDQSILEAPPEDAIVVVADVENTGGIEVTRDIDLTIDGQLQDTHNVTLGMGESESLSLQWDTTSAEPGSYVAELTTGDANATASVTVLEPAFFAVNIDLFYSDQEITQGWTAEVTADIDNIGQVEGQQTVELHVDGTVEDSIVDLVIPAGESETVTLFWDTDGAGGDYEMQVHSHDDYDTMTLFVEDDCSVLVDIGDQCVDGTYYAGDFGGDPYYTTETSVGPSDTFRWGQDSTDTGATSSTDGQSNTATLMTTDDSGAPYEAAEACGNLDENGRDDWFLPARDELSETIGDNRGLLPNVESTGHWSSTGRDGPNNHTATYVNMDGNSTVGTGKTSEHLVRCLRK